MSNSNVVPTLPEPASLRYVVGIDIGSQTCAMCCLTPEKRQVFKPTTFANTREGIDWLFEKLSSLKSEPSSMLVGLEATSRYGENLSQALLKAGYRLCLLHPAQVHAFAQQRGLRAKTDQLDAGTIARVLLSGEARFGYLPDEHIGTYRELLRLQQQLSEDSVRYKNELHALLVVLFPEFVQVFADPTRPTALAVLKRYPSAQAVVEAGIEPLSRHLHELAPYHYGRPTAQALVALAQTSIASRVAVMARSKSLSIVCDQLEHTLLNLAQLEQEIDQLLSNDSQAKRLLAIAEFGPLTVAVLRAELGDVQRFSRMDQVVAYVGLDIQVKQSGKWKGQSKLSKRGSGRVRRLLYLAALRSLHEKHSPFKDYYQRLVDRGMKKGTALVAVMRKMIIVAVHLLKTQDLYDASKVGLQWVS